MSEDNTTSVQLDPALLSSTQRSRLFMSVIVPRPVAWVSTVSPDGVSNLAPFSFFGGICSDPPMLYINVSRRQGQLKDTAANILATREFVVHTCSYSQVEAMVQTAGSYPLEVNEFEKVGLTPIPSERVRPPRMAEALVAMECKLVKTLELGEGPASIFIGRVEVFHLREDLLKGSTEGPEVDVEALDPIARLSGSGYARLGKPFEVEWPEI